MGAFSVAIIDSYYWQRLKTSQGNINQRIFARATLAEASN
jgi:hypothetical protein